MTNPPKTDAIEKLIEENLCRSDTLPLRARTASGKMWDQCDCPPCQARKHIIGQDDAALARDQKEGK